MISAGSLTVTASTPPPRLRQLVDLLDARHSCRAFLPDEVPRETIASIVDTASRTPSWANSQPWHATIASGPALARLRQALQAHVSSSPPDAPDFDFPDSYSGVYQARRRECGLQLYAALDIAREDKAGRHRQLLRNYEFFSAPHVAILTAPAEQGVYGAVDCGGFVCAFLLAAEASGIASIAQAAPARYSPVVKECLGIGDDRRMVCAISFGFEDHAHAANSYRTRRAVVGELVTWLDH